METKIISEQMADIKSPITGGPVREVRGVKKFDFRNETYDVPVRFYKCVESQEEFTSGEQDEEWSSSLYSLYREKHGIPSPEEIQEFREKNELSLQELSSILGLDEDTLTQYEKGEVPNEAEGKLLSLCMRDNNLITLLGICKNQFSKDEYESMYDRIHSAIQ